MTSHNYQYGFSEMHPNTVYDIRKREKKAEKVLSVLSDYHSGKLDQLSVLDIGCSSGVVCNTFSKKCHQVIGTDIDESAVSFARENYSSAKLHFSIQDGMKLGFVDNFFDTVVCSHVYEHVPDPSQLLAEIHRVLKPGGVCYFAAGNRLKLIEPHYRLPFLSIIPRPLADLYMRTLRRGSYYYEELLTVWKLQDLVSQFEVIDYTLEIIENPNKYSATEMLKQESVKQRLAMWISRAAYWLSPTYIWLLRKPRRRYHE